MTEEQMTAKQKIIMKYYLLTKQEIAKEIFDFHMTMVEKLGQKVQGHTSGGWGVVDTAKIFNLSNGMISNYLNIHRRNV